MPTGPQRRLRVVEGSGDGKPRKKDREPTDPLGEGIFYNTRALFRRKMVFQLLILSKKFSSLSTSLIPFEDVNSEIEKKGRAIRNVFDSLYNGSFIETDSRMELHIVCKEMLEILNDFREKIVSGRLDIPKNAKYFRMEQVELFMEFLERFKDVLGGKKPRKVVDVETVYGVVDYAKTIFEMLNKGKTVHIKYADDGGNMQSIKLSVDFIDASGRILGNLESCGKKSDTIQITVRDMGTSIRVEASPNGDKPTEKYLTILAKTRSD